MSESTPEKIAIIGGGIAGLYCAYVLGRKGHHVCLYEKYKEVGGRIRTVRLKSSADKSAARIELLTHAQDSRPSPHAQDQGKPRGSLADLEFYAEFGPMRVELEKQILLRGLFGHLELKEDARNLRDRDEPGLIEFPSYSSPSAVNDPTYQLRPNEAGKSPMDLLNLALLRIVLKLEIKDGEEKEKKEFEDFRKDLAERVQLAAATGAEVLPVFTAWVKNVSAQQLFAIQCHGAIENVPLHALGFWNLLSDYLSHDAILKIRDLGTFYHLLPENPNAAEWLAWWLNGLSISDNLQGVFGGMCSLVERLKARIESGNKIGDSCVKIECKHEATQLEYDPQTNCCNVDFKTENGMKQDRFDRIILALPKAALRKLVHASRKESFPEQQIDELLSCAKDFPMVKVFVVIKDRWWGNERMANRYATRVPTRELHYWPARLSDRYGMIMFYTDRPATAFWANYVPPGPQEDVSYRGGETELPEATERRLLDKVVQYLNESNGLGLKREDILWYGIRDWAREPYGAANHCWRPERKYWKVMARLGQLEKSRIHICGEAYSDYHGFIEGALRSAVYAIHRILDGDGKPDFGWLTEYGLLVPEQEAETNNGAAKTRAERDLETERRKENKENREYLAALMSWAVQLDRFRSDTGSVRSS